MFIRQVNNIQVIKNCFVAVVQVSLLSRSCDTDTSSWASFQSPCRCSQPTTL